MTYEPASAGVVSRQMDVSATCVPLVTGVFHSVSRVNATTTHPNATLKQAFVRIASTIQLETTARIAPRVSMVTLLRVYLLIGRIDNYFNQSESSCSSELLESSYSIAS